MTKKTINTLIKKLKEKKYNATFESGDEDGDNCITVYDDGKTDIHIQLMDKTIYGVDEFNVAACYEDTNDRLCLLTIGDSKTIAGTIKLVEKAMKKFKINPMTKGVAKTALRNQPTLK